MSNSTKNKRLMTVATAHLDTIWNWDFEYVISKCLPKTLNNNFRLFEMFDEYRFNFEGAYRYELFEEYYPDHFEKLKKYIAEKRWAPCGSAYENGDVNVPSPEALFRNILIGNNYFEDKFGIRTNDIYLPDCFGFGFALPSIAAHSNLKGFTTQKLSWGSAYGNPFDIGKWYGVDGNYIYGVLRPGSYVTDFSKEKYVKSGNLHDWDFVKEKLEENEKYSLDFTVAFQGTGDKGGSPSVGSVKTMHKAVLENDSYPEKVSSDFIIDVMNEIDALPAGTKEKLPEWKNELVMTYHGVGGYTSRTIGKRLNSRNELLADAAERMSVIGSYLGKMNYPRKQLTSAWKRVIAHQFHDDLPGTSVQRAYKRSWNDLGVSLSQFENEYVGAVGAVAKALNTEVAGKSVVVSNPLAFERTEAVCLVIDSESEFIRVYDQAQELLSQTRILENGKREVTFIPTLKPLSVKVFSLRESGEACPFESEIRVTDSSVENSRVRVSINGNGEICEIFDKTREKQLLSAPIKFDIYEYFGTDEYPAWEIDYKEIACEPQYKAELVGSEITMSGAAKGEIKVTLKCDNSIFTYYVSLTAGSDRVDVFNEIEWRDRHRLVKVRFPLEASNEKALYDLGLGAIKRGNNTEELYEVPAQKWVDLTDFTGEFGTSVLSDCKYGWDKPDNSTLRLTAIHTPMKNYHDDSMQSMMDLGLNRFSYAIVTHDGDDVTGTVKEAGKFSLPMFAFETEKHIGPLGNEYSFGEIDNDSVCVRAVKKAERTDEIIIRVNEIANKPQSVTLSLGDGIASAREVYATEEEKGEATVKDRKLVFEMKPYEIKSFALTLENTKSFENTQIKLELPFNRRISSFNGEKFSAKIGSLRYTVPAEQFPKDVLCGAVEFKLGDCDKENAVLSSRQKISLPEKAKKLYLLAAEIGSDREEVFEVGMNTVKKKIAAMNEKVFGWDLYDMKETAFTKDVKTALEFTHAHRCGKDEIAKQSYFFVYEFDVENAEYFTLPKSMNMLVLAATVSTENDSAVLLSEYADKIENRKFTYSIPKYDRKSYRKYKIISYFAG